jgi:precorrin-2 dehydrogenase/sirohydrochlorin ferrochelatase
VLRRGDLSVAVATGGGSPALASWLRDELAGRVGPEYGTLVALLSDVRDRVRSTGRSTEDLDWRSVLDSDMLDLIRLGRIAEARERLQAWSSSSSA